MWFDSPPPPTPTPTPVPHIRVHESGQHWFRWWSVVYSTPSHYLNQCWVIVNWILSNKLKWNFNQNTNLFIHESAFENIACEMVAILSRGRLVKAPRSRVYYNLSHGSMADVGSLQWRHNDYDGFSDHQPHGCLLNRLFRRRSKKTSKLASLAFVWGIHRDRWIPRTKAQLRGKCFHLMTSSWLMFKL